MIGPTAVRYHFSDFTLSPRRRALLRSGREVPLIPRYFDLLVYLVEHRHEAVHRRDIFDNVWSDVIVSDAALSQAIRTIRRALGDDSREPRFVRTVSRHGYRFVATAVREESEDAGPVADAVERGPAIDHGSDPARLPGARPVARPVAGRWLRASLGSGIAGASAGALGGVLLVILTTAQASPGIVPVLALVGLVCGGLAGAGVAGGLEIAEAVARSRRVVVAMLGAAIGGACVGTVVQWMARWTLAALVGVHFAPGGGPEGLLIGAAAGLGYGLGTYGMADGPVVFQGTRPTRRVVVVLAMAGCCGLAALVLALAGRPLVGGTLHLLADHAQGAQTSLAPIGRLLGEPGFGAVTSALIASGEGAVFGLGLALGLTWRTATSRSRTAHATLTST